MTKVIDGKALAAAVREVVADSVARLASDHKIRPGLAVVLVGDDPASHVYVRNKTKQALDAGLKSREFRLSSSTPEEDILALLDDLNRDPTVHGILVQLPLPEGIDEAKILESIDPAKDVDGFHPIHVGRLSIGQPSLIPCTPYGSLLLLRSTLPSLAGLHAIVIGRSNIVGKPMAQLLLAEHCTVTIAHSRTQNLPMHVRSADIVIAAVGRPQFVRGEWLKPGSCVIDVGINRIANPDGTSRLVGDVAYEEAIGVVGAITPVPGGVGPMTIACLLRNTVVAACLSHNLPLPKELAMRGLDA